MKVVSLEFLEVFMNKNQAFFNSLQRLGELKGAVIRSERLRLSVFHGSAIRKTRPVLGYGQ